MVDARIVRTRNDVLRAAIDVLIDEGWEAVTQPHVARVAGYSKATVYAHWPDRLDLLRDAFAGFGEMPHHEPTGDLRTDIIGELTSFRTAMVERRLDRALAVLAERTSASDEVVEIRDAFVDDGGRPLRRLLATVVDGARLEAATLMLNGSVLHSVLMHGRPPSDEVIEAAVDLTLRGLGQPTA
ncbi:MAG TPA: TetR/AcrR family transcriptional regulator [Pseudonocardia sp.]|nr:TetR/AcrR family transcriptional regulator [Pseudonocardia sp.]